MIRAAHVDALMYWDLKRRGFEGREVKVEGCKVHYLEYSPPSAGAVPIIFVHGIGANATNWRDVLVRLREAGHRILVPDLPGHGLSELATSALDPHVLQRLFTGFLEHVAPERALLVGNSLGGAVVLREGFERPERAVGVVALSPAGGFETDREWEDFKARLRIEDHASADRFVKMILPRLRFPQSLLRPLIRRIILENMAREGVRQLVDETRLEHFLIDELPKRMRVPTLFVWGTEENLFPRKNLAWFRQNLAGPVTFEEPELMGHCPQMDAPGWVARRVLAFASQLNAR